MFVIEIISNKDYKIGYLGVSDANALYISDEINIISKIPNNKYFDNLKIYNKLKLNYGIKYLYEKYDISTPYDFYINMISDKEINILLRKNKIKEIFK